MAKKGVFIVIEGTDGSGKTVQFDLLKKYLARKGRSVKTVDFPQYGKPSAYFVERYLNGDYGSWEEIDPRAASLFYALDRLEVGLQIRKWLREGKIVLSNRYVASNLGHQGAKFKDDKKRAEFMKWVYNLEYGIIKIPKPDLNIFLSVPPEVSYALLEVRKKKSFLKRGKKDIHEELGHLKRAARSYAQAIKIFPNDFRTVTCAPHGTLLPIETIHETIKKLVQKYADT